MSGTAVAAGGVANDSVDKVSLSRESDVVVEAALATDANKASDLFPESKSSPQESWPKATSLSKSPTHHKQWRNISAVTVHANIIYVVDSDVLYAYDPVDGSCRNVGHDDWQNVGAMGTASGHIYILRDDQLYEVNPMTGVRRSLGQPGWTNTKAIVTVGSTLYIIGEDQLHRVEPSDGSRESLQINNATAER